MTTLLNELSLLCKNRLETLFETYLIKPRYCAPTLQNAMIYSVQNGGKRVRPLLVYAVGKTFEVANENMDAAACAIELIHCYSLIHDDLPAMDNADLRRGKPSCHKAFDEATAILAGDAFQPLAFSILATHPSSLSEKQRLMMITTLSEAAGVLGMASGQALDLAGVSTISELNEMYDYKTGALLVASVKLGLIAANNTDIMIENALHTYIKNIALAFQIQDDLLDIQGDPTLTGKPQGIDQTNQKITYPNILGIKKTQALVEELFAGALQAVQILGNNAEILRELAYYLLHRKM